MSNSTITLQSVVNVASTHLELLPLANVGGFYQEPALSLANDTLSDLLFSEIDWDFNRIEMPLLVTARNKQDYIFAGASAFTLTGSRQGAAVGLAQQQAISQVAFVTTVTTLEPHRFVVGDTVYMTGNQNPSYNSTFTDDGNSSQWSNGWVITAVTATSFTFVHTISGLGTSGAPGISDYAWLASASMVSLQDTSSPRRVYPLEAVKELPVWSIVAIPEQIAIIKDNGDGTVKIRFCYVPGDGPWGANLVYQGKAPLKTNLTDTWAPFPDHYQAIYRQGFLYRCYRYLNSPKADSEYTKLQQEILKAQGAQDRAETNVHLVPESPLVDSWGWGF